MNITEQVSALISEVRSKVPLVHQITNYVTVNDCANITLAVGASPIMADDISEAAEITSISSALVINIGTLNERTVASMLASGKRANELGIPVIFDPVGAGASKLRSDTTKTIMNQIKLAVLRGNLSEISFVAGLKATTRGVDASAADLGNDAVAVAQEAARQLDCVVAVTGAEDVISDGRRTVIIQNGHKMLSRVTGTGCMATALVGAFAGATGDFLAAAAAGIASMGIAGEIAFEKAGGKGTGSFRSAIIDAVSLIDRELLKERAKINEI
ncbi:MAG TPA: hydroxyethylthiazole kinase [Syntrophomonas sp.]|nr:hydroxyethylthiazole kinase [Syntrophomonas sp.]